MATLVWNGDKREYYGDSTDTIPDGLAKGDKAYFYDEEKRKIYNGSTFEDYNSVIKSNIDDASLGQYGGKRIVDGTPTAPDDGYVFIAIKALASTIINTTTGNITGLNGATVQAGDYVIGRFTSVTLTSGDAIFYHGV